MNIHPLIGQPVEGYRIIAAESVGHDVTVVLAAKGSSWCTWRRVGAVYVFPVYHSDFWSAFKNYRRRCN